MQSVLHSPLKPLSVASRHSSTAEASFANAPYCHPPYFFPPRDLGRDGLPASFFCATSPDPYGFEHLPSAPLPQRACIEPHFENDARFVFELLPDFGFSVFLLPLRRPNRQGRNFLDSLP